MRENHDESFSNMHIDDKGILSFRMTNVLDRDEIEKVHIFLIMLASYCSQQSKLHEISRLKFRNLNHGLAIPAILLSTISGSVNLVSAISSKEANNMTSYIISMICGVSGLISAGILSVHRYANYAEQEHNHAYFVDAYDKQNLDIRSNIVIDNTENKTYVNLYEYLKHAKNEVSLLIDKAPPVPDYSSKQYVCKNKRELLQFSQIFDD